MTKDLEQATASPSHPSPPASMQRMPWEVRESTKYFHKTEGRALIMGAGDSETMVPIAIVDNSRDGIEAIRLDAPRVAAFIVKAVNSHQQLVDALNRIAAPHDCGCWPCTGQCRSQEALQITVDAMRDIAEAALTATEA